MAALLQRSPYNVPIWIIGDLTLMQLKDILLPEDLPIMGRIRPVETAPRGPVSPTGKDRLAMGSMQKMEVMKKVESHRYGLFDRVCDHLKKTPRELMTMRIEDLAQAFVEVTKLPIEKFPPDKLRLRTMQYVQSKGL